jgi:glycyl-tRNA synthetase
VVVSTEVAKDQEAVMQKIVSLCKRRGFVFQSSEIYGGLKSCYDYGPLGVELKRNVKDAWWRSTVHSREDVVGIDASIIMHPRVWEASGHLATFTDPLVDCPNCKARMRADHLEEIAPGTERQYDVWEGGRKKGKAKATASSLGRVCEVCGNPDLPEPRRFNLMFQTQLGPVSIVNKLAKVAAENPNAGPDEIAAKLDESIRENAVYLRPETAQAMFVNFKNVQATYRMAVPFGIAQVGKSFRNEITTEHFTYRSCEFEQMELEFFIKPGTEEHWFKYWCDARLQWYVDHGIDREHLRLRPHEPEELSHYSTMTSDVEYLYPWGWGELEGIAYRGNYDLSQHAKFSGEKLTYFDPHETNPETGKQGRHYVPEVIEPAAGADRATLAFLLEAYDEVPNPNAKKKEEQVKPILRLHPRIAPIKVAVLPLVKNKPDLVAKARQIVEALMAQGINAFYDEKDAIGRRYWRQDEAGTPYCLTVDHESLGDDTVTIRYRDDQQQDRIKIDEAVKTVRERLWSSAGKWVTREGDVPPPEARVARARTGE